MPEMYKGLIKIKEAVNTPQYAQVLQEAFMQFTAESIDYGIMEKSQNIFTIPGSFGWDDVGSWLALERVNRTDMDGNMLQGDVITINTSNTVVVGNKKLIATVGAENMIIVDTDDALLICAKNATQDVKRVIEELKILDRNELM